MFVIEKERISLCLFNVSQDFQITSEICTVRENTSIQMQFLLSPCAIFVATLALKCTYIFGEGGASYGVAYSVAMEPMHMATVGMA